ncbi:disintegrin and metalloproteinase domain-containing protein 15-like [Limulus polyphemus]|uniref:Disintegrin and metalloproteinase domain-containing protein 15-like n=1 Tax=Limulus polyphemus TaxID=6850 RepID=A0ABM1SRC9_LIMPO|nr:disintegrin and metalloproteinase domain-containing protein 15-like [Limulus polyphemus]
MKKDKDLVFERSKEIANIVSGLYLPLNIYIALVGVIVWSEHDEITLSSDGDTTLTNFLHYRRERLVRDHPNDNAQLVTGMAFDGGVVGKALKGPICTYQYSGGVNMVSCGIFY